MAEPILASLAAACAVSRGTAALLMYRHRYAREEGLGNVFIGKIDGRQTCVTLGLAAIFAAVLLPGMHGVAAMVVTMVAISSSVSFSNVRWAGKPAIRWELL